jgi:hypothetical protein
MGATPHGSSWVSTLERALLDAAARPELVGGAAVLAEAMVAAGRDVDTERLTDLAKQQDLGLQARAHWASKDHLDRNTPDSPLDGVVDAAGPTCILKGVTCIAIVKGRVL